jgi:hypothetical protein
MECSPQYAGLSSTSVLRLAEAVSRDVSQDVGLLDRDNRRTGAAPLTAALASGSAFYVEVAEHLLAIDADDVGAGYFTLTETLADLDIETVEVASGGEGRRHLYVSLDVSVTSDLRANLTAAVRRLGLDPRPTIRPPLSPHRLGRQVTLLAPTDVTEVLARLDRRATTAEQVARLLARLPSEAPSVTPAAHIPALSALSEDILRLLREGDTDGRYASTSEAIWAVELAAANRGWPVGRVIDALSGSPLWSQSSGIDRDGEQYVEADYARALQRVADRPRTGTAEDVRLLIAQLMASADRYRFRSGFGSRPETLAKAVQGMLDVAMKAGTIDGLNVSCHLLADHASMSSSAAARALSALQRQSVIEVTTKAQGEMATTYRLRLEHPCFALDVPVDEYRPVDVSLDAFRARGAVGAAGSRLLRLIASSHTATSEADLLALYGTRSDKALRRLLYRLADAGLITQTEDGWLAVSSDRRRRVLASLARLCDHRHTDPATGETVALTIVDCHRLRRKQQRNGWKRYRRARRLDRAEQDRTIREEADAQQAAEMVAEYAERDALWRELAPTG